MSVADPYHVGRRGMWTPELVIEEIAAASHAEPVDAKFFEGHRTAYSTSTLLPRGATPRFLLPSLRSTSPLPQLRSLAAPLHIEVLQTPPPDRTVTYNLRGMESGGVPQRSAVLLSDDVTPAALEASPILDQTSSALASDTTTGTRGVVESDTPLTVLLSRSEASYVVGGGTQRTTNRVPGTYATPLMKDNMSDALSGGTTAGTAFTDRAPPHHPMADPRQAARGDILSPHSTAGAGGLSTSGPTVKRQSLSPQRSSASVVLSLQQRLRAPGSISPPPQHRAVIRDLNASIDAAAVGPFQRTASETPPREATETLRRQLTLSQCRNQQLENELRTAQAQIHDTSFHVEIREQECVELNDYVDNLQKQNKVLREELAAARSELDRSRSREMELLHRLETNVATPLTSSASAASSCAAVEEVKKLKEALTTFLSACGGVLEVPSQLTDLTDTNSLSVIQEAVKRLSSRAASDRERVQVLDSELATVSATCAATRVQLAESLAVLDRLNIQPPFPSELVESARWKLPGWQRL